MSDSPDREAALVQRRRARWSIGALIVVALLVAWGISAVFGGEGGGQRERKDKPDVACGADAPEPPSPQRYEAPRDVIQDGVDYGAVIRTSCGDITVDLLEDRAPTTVNNFVFLAQEGFYDGLKFYRVERNSVIESGDPNDRVLDPPDDAGYTIPDELPDQPRDYVFGVLAMANQGLPDTSSSRFFIVIHENRPAGYQAVYSIFGTVDEDSYEVLREIGKQPVRAGSEPIEAVRPSIPIYIETIEITER